MQFVKLPHYDSLIQRKVEKSKVCLILFLESVYIVQG
jgi:hypothetical protein